MKDIRTLIPDIYRIVNNNEWFTKEISEGFSREVGLRVLESFGPRNEVPRLRLSQMGERCPCELWHSIHSPLDAEQIPPWARIKFAYGHILEALVIAMAKAAGHEVTGEQDELILDGVMGHRDCIIDGNIVDVKSASSRAFQKFKDGSIRHDDSFGYLDQLDGYVVASLSDERVRNKRSGFLLAIDKTLGHLVLYEHIAREQSIRKRIRDHRNVISLDQPPACTCEEVPDGKSGNFKLGVRPSYSAFKYKCHPRLRTFLYADGPRYLTKVVRKPDVVEIDKYGKIVYNG